MENIFKIQTTAPQHISEPIIRLCKRINPAEMPIYTPLVPESDPEIGNCFWEIKKKTDKRGGDIQFGWAIWQWPDRKEITSAPLVDVN
jgi:hypothetical protein